MAIVLVPLPREGFDPTECGVPWRVLVERGHQVLFSTPDGRRGTADPRMVTGADLGLLAPLLMADANGRAAYQAMAASDAFNNPIRHDEIAVDDVEALLLPGGHAPGMRPYLESPQLQSVVVRIFERKRPVGAICHGVLLPARSKTPAGRSVLHGLRTTALTRHMELTAWGLTCLHLGRYYRTYPTPVEDEVRTMLAKPEDFIRGPLPLTRDSPDRPTGFAVRDGHYLSARWPGDAHRFAFDFAAMLEA
jgi:protease I